MRNSIIIVIVSSILIAVLSLTGVQTEEEAVQDAITAAKKVFNSNEKIEVNHSKGSFSMYLPDSLEVTEHDASNVILKNGDQTYIVFYNSLEDPLSKLGYKSVASKSESALLLETYEDEDKFGYIRILENDEGESYELQIGVGGVKVTTYTSKAALENDSKNLMKMARSIALQNSNTVQK
ncbi:hypothetical protein [Virgibacillus doumboii]|uniref:hypothetical protein n=1 Tax=Virgibacillus doumboii TaxID=2697503 RepID=UPI0013DFE3C7|nr:hypothetical protein [Virgibacillus doumboii]